MAPHCGDYRCPQPVTLSVRALRLSTGSGIMKTRAFPGGTAVRLLWLRPTVSYSTDGARAVENLF